MKQKSSSAKPWLSYAARQFRDAIDAIRQKTYASHSDPVFFKWQRGEATEQDWLDAVAAVRAAHPEPA